MGYRDDTKPKMAKINFKGYQISWQLFTLSKAIYTKVQYNLSTPALVYSGFLSNLAKNSGPNIFPIYLNVKNTSVIRIL